MLPRMRWTNILMALGLTVAGCDDKAPVQDTYVEADTFCTTYDQANTAVLQEGELDNPSGRVVGQLIQNVVTDPLDPQYVGFVDYLLENLDVGGQPTVGRTDADGRLSATLGPGSWNIKTSGNQGVYYCAAEYAFTVNPSRTTRVCVDMNCR